MFLSAYLLHGCILLVELVELQQQKSSSLSRSSSTHHSIQIKSLNHSQLFLFLMMFILLCLVYQLNPKLYEIYVVQNISITIHLTVSVKPVLGEKVLGVKDVEKNSGQDIQLKVIQKLYPISYILHKTSSLGSNYSFLVQALRTSLIYPISIAHWKQ